MNLRDMEKQIDALLNDQNFVTDFLRFIKTKRTHKNICNNNCSLRLYEVNYRMRYSPMFKQSAFFLSNTKKEALDKFWLNKNKCYYDIISVCLVNNS